MGLRLSVSVHMSSLQLQLLSGICVGIVLLQVAMRTAVVCGFGMNLIQVPSEDKSQVACTLALLRKYFDSVDALSGAVLCVSVTPFSPELQEPLMSALNHHEGYPWTIITTKPQDKHQTLHGNLHVMHEKPQCYLIIVENLDDEDLDEIFNHWRRMLNWNPLAQFVVIFASVEETDEELTDLMVELLSEFMTNKLYNVNVIGQSEENKVYYGKTVLPYFPDNDCGNRVIAIELLDSCSYEDGSEEDEDSSENDSTEDNFADENDDEDTKTESEESKDNEGTENNFANESDDEERNKSQSSEDTKTENDLENEKTQDDEDINVENNKSQSYEESKTESKESKDNEGTENNFANESDDEENNKSQSSEDTKTENEDDLENERTQEDENIDEVNNESQSSEDTKTENEETKDNLGTENTENDDEENNKSHSSEDAKTENMNDDEDTDETATIIHLDSYIAAEELVTDSSESNIVEHRESKNSNDSANTNEKPPEALVEEYMRARFEDKFPRDLSGCPLRAAYRGPWEPFIYATSQAAPDYYEGVESVSYGESYTDAEEYDAIETEEPSSSPAEESIGKAQLIGIEYQLLQTIAQQLHVTIDFKMQSSNVFHLLQQLMEGQIELIVGGIDEDPSVSQFVSSSTSYYQDELTWCVAKAKRKTNFFNFLASINTYTWLLLLFFIIICSLAVLAAQRVSGFHLSGLHNYLSICIRIFGILLTQGIDFSSQVLPMVLRLLFVMAFFMGFFFSNTYQSFLISTLTTPTTQAQVSHLEEIYANRMKIMVSSENVRHLNKQGEIFKYIREKFEICYNIVECLNQAADNEQIAVAVSREHAIYNARIQRDKLFCFDRRESLYVYPVIMLLPKKYLLMHQINGIIQNVIESGHMQKWARDLDMVRIIHENIALVKEDSFKALTLVEFQGAFIFASGLLLLASGVFAIECLTYWLVVRRRSRLKPLRCLHRRFNRT